MSHATSHVIVKLERLPRRRWDIPRWHAVISYSIGDSAPSFGGCFTTPPTPFRRQAWREGRRERDRIWERYGHLA